MEVRFFFVLAQGSWLSGGVRNLSAGGAADLEAPRASEGLPEVPSEAAQTFVKNNARLHSSPPTL